MLDIKDRIDFWVEEGIISESQAERMIAAGSSPPEEIAVKPPRISLAAEALGYAGGALAIAAVFFLVGEFWQDLTAWTRCGVLAVTSAALLIGGSLLRIGREPAAERLRSVLWTLALIALGGSIFQVTDNVAGWEDYDSMLVTGLAVAAAGSALYLLFRRGLQQLAILGALLLAFGGLMGRFEEPAMWVVGLGMWGFGLAWLAAARFGPLLPRQVGILAGGALALLGSQMFDDPVWVGYSVGVVTAGALIGGGIIDRDLWLTWLGAFGVFVTVPQLVFHWFGETAAAPIALLVTGLLLVGAAAYWVRSGRGMGLKRRHS